LFPLLKPQTNCPELADNACGAIARLISSDASYLPLHELLPVLVANLPLKADLEENLSVYPTLIKLLHQQNAAIALLMPQIVDVFSKVLDANSNVQSEIQAEIAKTLRALVTAYSNQLQPIIVSLSQQQQETIKQLLV